MEFEKVVKQRKSVRFFRKDDIDEKEIVRILELVRLAPPAGDLQAYKVYVVRSGRKKEELEEASGFQEFVGQASVVLVFCADREESAKKYGERGRSLYALQDATIACSYAQLAAADLGLSGCWVGAFEEDEVQKILNTDLLPVAILPLGYPAEEPERPVRKKLSEITRNL